MESITGEPGAKRARTDSPALQRTQYFTRDGRPPPTFQYAFCVNSGNYGPWDQTILVLRTTLHSFADCRDACYNAGIPFTDDVVWCCAQLSDIDICGTRCYTLSMWRQFEPDAGREQSPDVHSPIPRMGNDDIARRAAAFRQIVFDNRTKFLARLPDDPDTAYIGQTSGRYLGDATGDDHPVIGHYMTIHHDGMFFFNPTLRETLTQLPPQLFTSPRGPFLLRTKTAHYSAHKNTLLNDYTIACTSVYVDVARRRGTEERVPTLESKCVTCIDAHRDRFPYEMLENSLLPIVFDRYFAFMYPGLAWVYASKVVGRELEITATKSIVPG